MQPHDLEGSSTQGCGCFIISFLGSRAIGIKGLRMVDDTCVSEGEVRNTSRGGDVSVGRSGCKTGIVWF